MVTLDALGPRICIMCPSSSGKSTLASVIAAARGMDVVHLDQLYHLPQTDWMPRPGDDFARLHDAAIAGEHWVVEGNYSRLLDRRLERATGFILLDVSTQMSLYRYLRRCLFEHDRQGALAGARDRVSWSMIRHIVGATRGNRRRYRHRYAGITVPKVQLDSAKAIAAFCAVNDLTC